MKIGITGHQYLPEKSTWDWVEHEIEHAIKSINTEQKLIGLSSLAIGADQLFARLILKAGGRLHAIIPFAGYELTFNTSEDLASYKDLISKAFEVQTLNAEANDEESFFAAGKRIATECDVLVAVWNGKKAKGLGGTADVVHYAQKYGKRIFHLNTLTYSVTQL